VKDIAGPVKAQVKPLFLMMQIISGWTQSFFLKYPEILEIEELDSFNQFMSSLSNVGSYFALNIQVGSLKCAVGTLMEFYITMGLMLSLFVALALSSFVTALCTKAREKSIREAWEEFFAPVYVLWAYLLYATLCTRIVQMVPIRGATFDCTFEDVIGCRLRVDYRIAWDDDEYQTLGMPVAYGAVALIVIGVPLSFLLGMLHYRSVIAIPQNPGESEEDWCERREEEAAKDEEIYAFSDLFSNLRPRYWYFEVINLARQFVLIGLLIMFQTTVTVHLYLSIIVLALFAGLIFLLRPYVEDAVNKAHFFCAMALILMMLTQLVMLASVDDPDLDPAALALQGKVLAISSAAVFLFVGTYMGVSVGTIATSASKRALIKLRRKLIVAAEPQLKWAMEPQLQKHGVEWDDVWGVLEEELGNIDSPKYLKEKLRTAVTRPRSLIKEFFLPLRPIFAKACVGKLPPVAQPWLTAKGLDWEDVHPMLAEAVAELSTFEGMSAWIEGIVQDASGYFDTYLEASRPLLVKTFLWHFRSLPDASEWFKENLVTWDEVAPSLVEHLENLEGLDALKSLKNTALKDPRAFLDEIGQRSVVEANGGEVRPAGDNGVSTSASTSARSSLPVLTLTANSTQDEREQPTTLLVPSPPQLPGSLPAAADPAADGPGRINSKS
jgi:hypothetical protein